MGIRNVWMSVRNSCSIAAAAMGRIGAGPAIVLAAIIWGALSLLGNLYGIVNVGGSSGAAWRINHLTGAVSYCRATRCSEVER